MSKDFYIGYLPKMPATIKRAVKPTAIFLVIIGVLAAAVIAISQGQFANSVFEFGNVREFRGSIQAEPVPFLLVERTEKNNGLPSFFRYPLVGEGKYSVGDLTEFNRKEVSFSGTLIYRDGIRMIEVVGGSIKKGPTDSEKAFEEPVDLGEKTLRGEIIDSKCYLGVMNPGDKKAHRSCAVACLRGGVPALYVVKDESGKKSELWLVSEQGKSVNDEVLDYVAEPVEVSGQVTRQGDQLFFSIDPKKITRL